MAALSGVAWSGPDADRAPRVVVLGDSLASGHGIPQRQAFPAVLQDRIDAAGMNYRVINGGVSGDTSIGGLRRLEGLLRGDVRVLVLELGVNDGLRGVATTQVKANLAAIIRAAQARGIRVLLCRMEATPINGWPYTAAFHRLYDELAREYDLPTVPFLLLGVIGNRSMMQADRIHPNAAGARAIADVIWPYLRSELNPV